MDGGRDGFSGAEENDRRGSSDRSSLSSHVINSVSTKWTDEKHSLYLNSIEASFIEQLYNSELRSQDLLGSLPRKHKQSNSPLSNDKGQAKYQVSRWGDWGCLHYERVKTRADIQKESHHLSANQWIRHFRSSISREEGGLSLNQLNLDESVGETTAIEKQRHRREESNQAERRACSTHLCRLDSVGSSSEVSDQNFPDEEDGEKSNSTFKRQRIEDISC